MARIFSNFFLVFGFLTAQSFSTSFANASPKNSFIDQLNKIDRVEKDLGDSSLQTPKFFYIDFWASWCPPCAHSFPWMNQLQEKYSKNGLKVIAVNLDSNREKLDKFLDKQNAEFEIRHNPSGSIAKNFGVTSMPQSYLLNSEGEVLFTHYGFNEEAPATLESKIEQYLEN